MKNIILSTLTILAISLSMQAQALVIKLGVDGVATNYLYKIEVAATIKKKKSCRILSMTRIDDTHIDAKCLRRGDGEFVLIKLYLK